MRTAPWLQSSPFTGCPPPVLCVRPCVPFSIPLPTFNLKKSLSRYFFPSSFPPCPCPYLCLCLSSSVCLSHPSLSFSLPFSFFPPSVPFFHQEGLNSHEYFRWVSQSTKSVPSQGDLNVVALILQNQHILKYKPDHVSLLFTPPQWPPTMLKTIPRSLCWFPRGCLAWPCLPPWPCSSLTNL